MTHPVDSVFVDGVNVSKAAARSYMKQRVLLTMQSLADLNATDLTGQYGIVFVRDLENFYSLDSSDHTSVDDGKTILVDAAGNRFKIVFDTFAIETRSQIELQDIPIYLDSIRTNGYSTAGDGGGALYKRVGSEPSHAGKVQSADGAWWELAEHFINPLMFGAIGNGVADDAAPVLNAYNRATEAGCLDLTMGRFSTSTPIGANNIAATAVYSDKPSRVGYYDGTLASPSTENNDPVVWVQKVTKYDNGVDRFAQNIGGVFAEVVVKGQGASGATNVDGSWIGIAGNAVLKNTNHGSPTVQDWDGYGSVIGVVGFASADGYPGNNNVVTGTWSYSCTPNLDDTTFNNLPAGESFVTIGHEINIDVRHKDAGAQTILYGHGSTVGQLIYNYRTTGAGVKHWTFGTVLAGTPNDGNFVSTNPDNWSGFHTGHFIDQCKAYGILFGQYSKNTAYLIAFPTSYPAAALRPAAAIRIGDNVINMGDYVGATFADGDFWVNAGTFYYRYTGINFAFGRKRLIGNINYYVRTDGSDSNNGLANTAGGAFLTIQKAIDVVAALDLGIYNATIQVADGTYSGSAVLKPVVGAGKVYLIGNVSSPQNCVISGSTTPLSNLIGTVAPVVGWYVKGFELRTSGGGGYTNVYLTDGASVTFDGPMRLGSNNGIYYGHIYVEKGAKLSLVGQALTVAASGPAFLFQTATAGQIDARNAAIAWLQNTTYSGTVYAIGQSSIAVGGVTWTLNGYTITTTYWRYCAGTLSIVDSNGGGASFIPGSAAGVEQNNGKYL